MMSFEWDIKVQGLPDVILDGAGKYAGSSGAFYRSRALTSNFAGAETSTIPFIGLLDQIIDHNRNEHYSTSQVLF